jgi:hypothetical protein
MSEEMKKLEANRDEIEKILRETKVEGIEELILYLENTDFFSAPASTKYHNSHIGGLAEHSLSVYKLFSDKVVQHKLDTPHRTVAICGLLHDLCKTNQYYMSEYKTKEGGRWVCTPKFPAGHGEKSVFLILPHIQLTEKEIICIRFHMGSPSDFYERMNFDQARNEIPELTLLMCADLISSFVVEARAGK